ncbi:hypothetical protein JB92DRAFT_1306645 [Gautieria morchelliformis]|nr:hypothetical protein JB92DRAFT_1306645 [Gautieria morchelliformis]
MANLKTSEDYDTLMRQYIQEAEPLYNLRPAERFWITLQPWLASCGYILRPRYRPGWVPSWIGTDKVPTKCEDGIAHWDPALLDATRASDGKLVMLKLTFRSVHPFESEIGRYLSSKTLASDPSNHCIPILDVLVVPDYEDLDIIAMPLLLDYDYSPSFKTVGESVEFFRQIFEGLLFMHRHHVAHRDCSGPNIMMDGTKLYPDGFHPMQPWWTPNRLRRAKHRTRTERPPKYYLTDFGLSRRYDPKAGPGLELPIRGNDKTVPEFQGNGYYQASDPFATDVYYIGNEIKTRFLQGTVNFDFMSSLIADMTANDPAKRLSMDQVVDRFDTMLHSLTTSQLRARLMKPEELDPSYWLVRWILNIAHFFRQVKYVLYMIPPVPPRDA